MAESEQRELVDIAAITDKEKKLIPETRRLIAEILENGYKGEAPEDRSYLDTPFAKRALDDDWPVAKYLRLAHHKPKNAAKLFHETLKWRKETDIDNVHHERFPKYDHMKKYFPFGWHGTTRYGNPIHYDCPGYLDIDSLFTEVNVDDLVDYHVAVQEYMATDLMNGQTEKTGRRIHQIFVIINLENAGRAQMANIVRKYLERTSIIDQQHYPDAMVRMFIINAPWVFSAFWSLLKVFLNERTRNKTHILGSNFHDALAEYIDADQLPTFAGGKCPNNCTPQNYLQCHAMETDFRERVLSPPSPRAETKESAAVSSSQAAEASSSSRPASSSSSSGKPDGGAPSNGDLEIKGSSPDYETQSGDKALSSDTSKTAPSSTATPAHSSPPSMSGNTQAIAVAS